MTELPDRVVRAFEDHGSFERTEEGDFRALATPFEGRVAVDVDADGGVEFAITVRVPMLSDVAEGVAPVVEDGWYETFELRIEDIGAVTHADRDLSPTVRRDGTRAAVEATFVASDARRGVDDTAAVINYVEGTYIQGIVPGYEYDEPIAGLLSDAHRTAGAGGGSPP